MWTGIGGLAALVALFIPFLVKERAHPPGTNGALTKKSELYPNTIDYWNQWAAIRKQHTDRVSSLNENESPEDAINVANSYVELINTTLALSQVGVDPEMSQLALDFVAWYKLQIRCFNMQSAWLHIQAALEKEKRGEGTSDDVDAYILQMVGTYFMRLTKELPREEALQKAREEQFRCLQEANEKFSELSLNRDKLRARLVAEHGQELSW